MADEGWQKVRSVFDSALCRRPEERTRFVREACGADRLLRAEIESLLSSLESAEDFMETPAIAAVASLIEAETKTFEPGKCFGHYEIVRRIGVGGTGEVYLARDKTLDRPVAVKILSEKFNRDESNLHRFVAEAKAASALNHPNILVVHEIGESADAHYIVSEFIEGKTLREILSESRLNLPEILDISIQLAGALFAAHESGLIHRDIKPENLMIRPDGYVKILDFGLAKLVEQKKKTLIEFDETDFRQNRTAQGVILGTVNYMSPEQARGARVDERTDIFSFGVLLYEMLTGQTPFAADSLPETLANLISDEPPPLSLSAADVPAGLERIVAKMLRKNRRKRYQTMKALLADLKDLRKNLLYEQKSRRSDFREDRRENVQDSSVYQSAGRAGSGEFQAHPSKPANAYQAFQLARYYYNKVSFPDLVNSRLWLEEALRFDADFAPVHIALAEQFVMEVITGLHAPAENFPKAKRSLRRAAELNSRSAEFFAVAGFTALICDWNFKKSERSLRKALNLNSYHAFASKYLAEVLMFQCRTDEAEFHLRMAQKIEPMNLHIGIISTISHFLAREYQRVIEECERFLSVYPHFVVARWMRCWAFEQTGRAADAISEYEKILSEPGGEVARRWLGYAYALIGAREKAREIVALLDTERRAHYLSPTHQAMACAALGDTEKAFSYLERGIAERDPWMLWLAADPRFDNLRADPRFERILRAVGLK